MNSSLQCLSNTYELTKFFLDQRFKFMMNQKVMNPLGTEGRLVMAYAKTVNEMWNNDSHVVTPDLFKKILGQYATQFQGFGQHDSHECINTVLDLLGEDLYRKGKKPYIDLDEKENLEEEDAAADAWNRHVHRNESIVTDLFHGQYKSTVQCSKCPRISITFDPMVVMSLPIPAQMASVTCFFVPHTLQDDFVNLKMDISIRPSDSWLEFRAKIKAKYGKDLAGYTITRVADCNMKQYYHTEGQVDQFTSYKQGQMLLYENDPRLKSNGFPQVVDKNDCNNGVVMEYTRIVLNQAMWKPHQYREGKFQIQSFLPRLIWVKKSTKLRDLHMDVFEHCRWLIAEWIDWKDPKTKKVPKEKAETDLRKSLPKIPFRQITKADFLAMPT